MLLNIVFCCSVSCFLIKEDLQLGLLGMVLILYSAVVFYPICRLFCVHIVNFIKGKTYSERTNILEENLIGRKETNNFIANFLNMCYFNGRNATYFTDEVAHLRIFEKNTQIV